MRDKPQRMSLCARLCKMNFTPAPETSCCNTPCAPLIFCGGGFCKPVERGCFGDSVRGENADLHALMNFVERHRWTMISAFPLPAGRDEPHGKRFPRPSGFLISGGDVLRGA